MTVLGTDLNEEEVIGAENVKNWEDAKRYNGEGNGNPLQYSCLESPMNGRAWQVTIHGVTKSQTRLSDFTYSLTQRDTKDFDDLRGYQHS